MSRPERILIFIDHFLPGYKAGGPVRSCANMIDRLKGRFRFGVVTRDREYMEAEAFQEVVSDSWNQREGYAVYYASEDHLSRAMIRKRIEEFAPDLVYINGIYSFRFSILPLLVLKRMRKAPNAVIAPRGMLAPGAMAVKPFKKRFFLLASRLFGLFRHSGVHATTEQEADEVRAWLGNKKLWTLPNLPPAIDPGRDPGIEKRPGELRLVSIARIAPEKNTLGLLELLADQGERGIHLDLYGPVYDPSYWERCQALIERMPPGVSVRHYSGVRPEDSIDVLREHHAFILMTRGENFGHAVLEALLAGRPVLISDRTPWTDIEEEGVGKLLRLEDPERSGSLIQEWLQMDNEQFRKLIERTRIYADKLMKSKGYEKDYEHMFHQMSEERAL